MTATTRPVSGSAPRTTAVTNPSRGRRPIAPMPAYAAPVNAPTLSSRPGVCSASCGAARTALVVRSRPFTSYRTASSPPDEKAHGMGTALLMRLSGLVSHRRRRTFGSIGNGLSRGDPQPQHPIGPTPRDGAARPLSRQRSDGLTLVADEGDLWPLVWVRPAVGYPLLATTARNTVLVTAPRRRSGTATCCRCWCGIRSRCRRCTSSWPRSAVPTRFRSW
jgi:hypothetical protein